MIHMAVDFCACHLVPAEECPNHPPPVTYEVLIPPDEGEDDAATGTD